MSETTEKHTRYSTIVDDLPSAWEFIMSKIDRLGPDPSIEIVPIWVGGLGEEDLPRRFSVSVSGATEVEDT